MTDSTAVTTLHWALTSKNKNEILKILLSVRQGDLKVPNENGSTVLHLALVNKTLEKNEIIELLKIFLDEGVDVYAENKWGKTVLHRAIEYRMKSVVDFLINREVDINRRDSKGNLVTHDFIEEETEWFYELLERKKNYFHRTDSVEVESESVKFLCRAYDSDREAQENESASFTKFLIGRGFDFDLQNISGKSAFHRAIERNLLHILHVLVKHARGIHFVDHREKSLLQLFIETKGACRDERKNLQKDWYPEYASRYSANIVRILLDRGVLTWPDDNNNTSLQTAQAFREDTNIVKMMIDHGLKSMENYSATAMFKVFFKIFLWCGVSKTEYFSTGLCGLIAKGADVNSKDESGMAPLYRAFHEKNIDAIVFLIELQADFSTKTSSDENLFHALAQVRVPDKPAYRRFELATLFDLVLIKGCCDVNLQNSANETPLHWAARCRNLVIVKKLIKSGAEVNCKDVNGDMPLHHALCHSKNEYLIKLLVESGAEVNCKDKCDRRPLSVVADVAPKLVPLFLKRGAYVNAYDVADLPFWKIILQENHGIAKEMLAYGADVNNNDAVVRSVLESIILSHIPKILSNKYLQKKLLLLEHSIKLKVANLPYSKEYEDCTNSCQVFNKNCLEEIQILKNTFIDDRVSIYSFLHMDFGHRRRHMNGEKLRQLVQSPDLEEQFPKYSVVILASYRETVLWKSLLEPAKLAWFKITNIRLPGECLEPIFAQLTNEDLINMIEFDEDV